MRLLWAPFDRVDLSPPASDACSLVLLDEPWNLLYTLGTLIETIRYAEKTEPGAHYNPGRWPARGGLSRHGLRGDQRQTCGQRRTDQAGPSCNRSSELP